MKLTVRTIKSTLVVLLALHVNVSVAKTTIHLNRECRKAIENSDIHMIAQELARDVSSTVVSRLKSLGAKQVDAGQLKYHIERKMTEFGNIDYHYKHDYYVIKIDQDFSINPSSTVQMSGPEYDEAGLIYTPSLIFTATPRVEKRFDKWGNLTERWCEIRALLSLSASYGPVAVVNKTSGKPVNLNQDGEMNRFKDWELKQSPVEYHY